MSKDKEENKTYSSRLREMTAVLHKHEITRGVSPEKLRMILEDLGPTYIKLGQIMSMHSDILPKRYCDELMRLHSEVAPMPFAEVAEVIQESYGYPWDGSVPGDRGDPHWLCVYRSGPSGHSPVGEQVVVKVQRKGIYEVMARDIGLLHKAAKLLPVTTLRGLVDLDMVLDELWMTTQEEMNFLTEAANAEEFARKNQDVVFVETPKLYREHTTTHVLVMEYVEGFPINAREDLLENGYDLKEIGRKFVDNYIKQVMEDGFFHADPHPGNVRIRGGKIVWLDMGMMGRLTERDRELIGEVIRGVASGDIGLIQEAVLALGDFRGKPDRNRSIRTSVILCPSMEARIWGPSISAR